MVKRTKLVDLVQDGYNSKPETAALPKDLIEALKLVKSYGYTTLSSQEHELLTNQAIRDPLTSLFNVRYFNEEFERRFGEYKRNENHASLVMLDIDHFKRINTDYGHPGGNYILKMFAGILIDASRIVDTVARLGGEEFAMILPGSDVQGAYTLAERIRTTIENTTFRYEKKDIKFTVSAGVSEFRKDDNPEMIYARADLALYLSKTNGRNMVSQDSSIHIPEKDLEKRLELPILVN